MTDVVTYAQVKDRVLQAFCDNPKVDFRGGPLAVKLGLPVDDVRRAIRELGDENHLVWADITNPLGKDLQARLSLVPPAQLARASAVAAPIANPETTPQRDPPPAISDELGMRVLLVVVGLQASGFMPCTTERAAKIVNRSIGDTATLLAEGEMLGWLRSRKQARWTLWSITKAGSEAVAGYRAEEGRAREAPATVKVQAPSNEASAPTPTPVARQVTTFRVGLFSSGELEIARGDDSIVLEPHETRQLFAFLDKFAELSEAAR